MDSPDSNGQEKDNQIHQKKKIIVVIPSAKNKCLVINFQRTTNLFNTPTSAKHSLDTICLFYTTHYIFLRVQKKKFETYLTVFFNHVNINII